MCILLIRLIRTPIDVYDAMRTVAITECCFSFVAINFRNMFDGRNRFLVFGEMKGNAGFDFHHVRFFLDFFFVSLFWMGYAIQQKLVISRVCMCVSVCVWICFERHNCDEHPKWE